MDIQVNTDGKIEMREKLSAAVTGVVQRALTRFGDRVTRVGVHISNQKSDRGSQDDKRCMMEARLEGGEPTSVTYVAANLDQAVDGAADRLKRSIENALERLHQREADDDLKRRGLERWDDEGGST